MVRDVAQDNDEIREIGAAKLVNPGGQSQVLLVCEHASNHVPDQYRQLGLAPSALNSHIAWDPGALALSIHLAGLLDARLVAGTVSRLVYDCNRPPDAPDAMPARSERTDIPGNANLTEDEKTDRIARIYHPFHQLVSDQISRRDTPSVLVTIHSFTPIYLGRRRDVEIGVLHDEDQRLADAILRAADKCTDYLVARNEPYGPADGVTHTLKKQGIEHGLLNVMLEVANNLIATPQDQRKIAELLSGWLTGALLELGNDASGEGARCHV